MVVTEGVGVAVVEEEEASDADRLANSAIALFFKCAAIFLNYDCESQSRKHGEKSD